MKKWNLKKNIYQNEQINKKYKSKIKHLNSLDLQEINYSKSKDKKKIYIKTKPTLMTCFHLYKNPKNQIKHKRNKSDILYRKKNISHSHTKYSINRNEQKLSNKKLNLKKIFYHKKISSQNIQLNHKNKQPQKRNKDNNFSRNKLYKNILRRDNVFNSLKSDKDKEFYHKKIKTDQYITDKDYNNGISITYSQNTEVNNFIDELKNKIILTKKTIYEMEKNNTSNNIIDITNTLETIQIFNSENNDNKGINKEEDSIINISEKDCLSLSKDSKLSKNNIFIKNEEDEKITSSKVRVSNYPKNMIKTINRIYSTGRNIDIIKLFSSVKYKNKLNILNKQYEPLFIKYLDNKSIIYLSSINKNTFKEIRIILYSIIYEKMLINKGNDKEKFMKKIIYSIFNHSSNKLKFRNKIQLKTKYNFYKYKSTFSDKIKQDLSRTFPKDPSFNTIENYNKLYNILTSYSNYNKLIGYTQGLNFIAGNCLYLFNTEEEVFLFLDCLINRFNLEKYLSIENVNLFDNFNHFSNLLNKHIPDIFSYFEEKQLNHCFFSIGWMITLFSNSMKRKYLNKTWCFMILLGWKFFYSLVIQILKYYKKDILSKEENKLSEYMKTIINNDNFCDNYNTIIRNTLCFMNDNIIL